MPKFSNIFVGYLLATVPVFLLSWMVMEPNPIRIFSAISVAPLAAFIVLAGLCFDLKKSAKIAFFFFPIFFRSEKAADKTSESN